MRLFLILLAGLLAACAPPKNANPNANIAAASDHHTGVVAAYLVGDFAAERFDSPRAAAAYSAVLAASPSKQSIIERAFLAHYSSGDLAAAAAIARHGESLNLFIPFGGEPALFLAIDSADWEGALVLSDHLVAGGESRTFGLIMGAWSLAFQGQGDAALLRLTHLTNVAGMDSVFYTQSALVADYLGQSDDAVAWARQALSVPNINADMRINMSGVLARNGFRSEALAALQSLPHYFNHDFITEQFNDELGALFSPPSQRAFLAEAVLDSIAPDQSGRIALPPDVAPNVAFGRLHLTHGIAVPAAGRLLYAMGLNYYRLGDEAAGDYYHGLIAGDDWWFFAAEILRAQRLSYAEKWPESNALFHRLDASNPDNILLLREWAAAARRNGESTAALALYDKALVVSPDNSDLHYFRATLLLSLGDATAAEAAYRKALSYDENHPYALNDLGYFLLEHDDDYTEAIGLIRTALSHQPKNGFFLDSLGWAYYRLGDFEKSWQVMVQAVMVEPSNALITEHLGDSFARARRMRGARYQWQRALDLILNHDGDMSRVDILRSKIANGLAVGQDDNQ